MTKTFEAVVSATKARDEAFEALNALKIEHAAAMAYARTAHKDEKVDAARDAAEIKAKVANATKALKDAEKALTKAEKAAEKAEKVQNAIAHKERLAQEKQERAQAAEVNPFLAEEVDYPAIAAWLVEKAKDRVCYVEGAGWGEWKGSHWEFARKPSASLKARVRRSYCHIDSEVVVKLNASARSAEYILEHAEDDLTVDRSVFNAPTVAHLVAFNNVTVDLRTGKTMKHNPKHYMTGHLPCNFDPNADIERVLTAFARFWPNDPETAEMFQTAVGYSLTGEVSAKRIFFMVGNQEKSLDNGDNGKSLVQNAMSKMFGLGIGGWGTAVKSGIIIDTGDRDANSHDGAKTPLIWRRYAMSSEFRHGAAIDAGAFNLISGGDFQTARPPHAEHAVEFVNFASMWFSMNSVPRFKTWDKATRVRLTPFPFNETFFDPGTAPEGGQEKEIGLKEWLDSEEGQSAIALYAVKGAMRFYANNGGRAGNFPNSAAVEELRDQILKSANPYAELFEDWLVFDKNADTQQSAINAVFEEFLGHRPKQYEKELFINALKGAGVSQVKANGGIRHWRGVAFTEKGREYARARGHGNAEMWRHLRTIAAE